MTKVLYTGSFDPITKGHMHLIERASELFDDVVVVVMDNSSKSSMFTQDERLDLIKGIYKGYTNIRVEKFNGAAVDALDEFHCDAILRGIRNTTDYEYEKTIARVNEEISNGKAKTICILSKPEYEAFSSTVVKEIFSIGKDISNYVDDTVKLAMIKKRK